MAVRLDIVSQPYHTVLRFTQRCRWLVNNEAAIGATWIAIELLLRWKFQVKHHVFIGSCVGLKF